LLCNQAGFVADVTIPDGTVMYSGDTFTKTWRLRNDGTCTWSPDYKLVFVSGNQLGGPDQLTLGISIVPGQMIDISLTLITPEAAGIYEGFYKLQDASGNTFGVGASGNGLFFVRIQSGNPTSSLYPQVSLSNTQVEAGDDVTVHVSGFPVNSEIDYRLGLQGEDSLITYDGTVGSDGTASKTVTLPIDALGGEYWVVEVLTTSLRDIVTVTSHTIYIRGSTTTGIATVSLSTTQAHAGEALTVQVRGFPANAEIDYRVGKQGEAYLVVYDGATGSTGSASQAITIPSSALGGEYWVVQVSTTNLLNAVVVTSHTIYITQ
jgi:hypothetical protein